MTQLYVIRWVLARGILVMSGKLARRKGAQKNWYSLQTSKWDRYRRHWVCIGNDAFLTLEDAQKAARAVFAQAALDAEARTRDLTLALEKIDRGELSVHDLTPPDQDTRISELHAFPSCPT